MVYLDRQDAGEQLAKALRRFAGQNAVVLALPRGGVVVGAAVARGLGVPLGLVLVRKIGHPYDPEYAIGAIADDGPPLYDETAAAGLGAWWRKQAEAAAHEAIDRRRAYYFRGGYTPPDISGKTAILVDDGMATGLTMQAAVQAVQRKHAKKVVVAVPVAPSDSVAALEAMADDVIVLGDPAQFLGAVGAHYHLFEQVDDIEVRELLWEVQDETKQSSRAANTTAAARLR